MVPNSLDEWTFETVLALCVRGQVETDRHDFKTEQKAESLTKNACAFANSKGGYIVFGVKQRGDRFSPEGLPADTEIARDFGHRIKANPTIQFESPKAIAIPGTQQLLYVFHIPRSLNSPHFDEQVREFWKRTNTGCERMTLEEMRFAFGNYDQRRRLLRLLQLELLQVRGQLVEMRGVTGSEGISLVTPDVSVISRILPDLYDIVESESELIQDLSKLRALARVIQTKIDLLTIGFRTSQERRQIFATHNTFVQAKVDEGVAVVDRCLQILGKAFGLSSPEMPS